MKLTIFNGSPRGGAGNTQALVTPLIKGFEEIPGNSSEVIFLRGVKDEEALRQAFADSELVFLAFPLYTDAMPAVVKEFIEALQPLCGSQGNPAVGFMVISGFPEGIHSTFVKRYLEKLAARLGCRCFGTIIKGNSEGIRWGSEKNNRTLFQSFHSCGKSLAETGTFDNKVLETLAQPMRMPKAVQVAISLASRLGLANKGWDDMLRGNKAYEKRFDRPYI
jgi:multimeric flavodoxin WrbA